MFPQLVAGPIVRYQTVDDQINSREHNFDKFNSGMERFIRGLFKKIIISNSVGQLSVLIYDLSPYQMSISVAWLGAIAYTLQIYFDFGGYSDMAIGLGKMLGFEFLENFNYPYISKSVSEFWRRWHISLGSWFRDYVYIPLGGNRVSNIKVYRNLSIVIAIFTISISIISILKPDYKISQQEGRTLQELPLPSTFEEGTYKEQLLNGEAF